MPPAPPELSSSVKRIFVHHTAVFPRYAAEESASLVARICRQHMEERGFSDIAYNFLIDRYGVIFQGRAGGILRPVVGAHAVGFNQESAGIALIGDFENDEVPTATAEALVRLTAWLCLWYDIDPLGRSSQRSTGGATTRYAARREVELPTIVGHRETGDGTPCPGRHMFAEIGSGRLASAVAAAAGRAGASAPRRGPAPPG
ncbi:MAG: peptidoglycan recognition protein family protein [Actinobacteria bacterium]|nr:peptidoglycan recognition protein family protein [Actinomycetota bacterium]